MYTVHRKMTFILFCGLSRHVVDNGMGSSVHGKLLLMMNLDFLEFGLISLGTVITYTSIIANALLIILS